MNISFPFQTQVVESESGEVVECGREKDIGE